MKQSDLDESHSADVRGVAARLSAVAMAFESGESHLYALRDIDLEIGAGDWVAVVGPSGSGKTSLLNVIGGLDRATAGEVQVLGHDLHAMAEGKLTAFRGRHLGIVFQEPNLLPGLTAIENVVMARLPWERAKELYGRAETLLREVGLGRRIDAPSGRLSGGEAQRVAIARALLGRPSLLLADEPTGNLDLGTTVDVLDLLSRLRDAYSLTVVVATHDAEVAARADRVVRLAGGRIVAGE